MEKYGFVYLWYDRKRKMYYIGCHWGTEDDGYVCSSSWMKQAYKHRPQDFKRRIIKSQIPRDNLLEEEFKWLSMIKDEELKVKYYNCSKRHFGHWAEIPDSERGLSVREKIKRKRKEQIITEDHKRNISLGLLGREVSDQTRKKLSEANIGKKHTLEAREKMRQAKLGKKRLPHSDATKAKMSASAYARYNKLILDN